MKICENGVFESERKYITVEELKEHNKSEDLWISIHGKVYNVTDWKKDHPGGDTPLLNLGGQDVTDAFIAYHPNTAWQHLEKFFTGFYLKDFVISDVSKDYRKLHHELVKMGLFEKKGHHVLWSLVVVAFLFVVVVYGVLCSESVFAHLCCGGILGLLWILSTYVGHDSGHYQIMPSPGYNKLAQFVTGNCITGISIAWWKWTHNAHHIAVNSLDYDPDLQHIPFFAVSSVFFNNLTSCFYGRTLKFDALARFLICYQHFTFYPVVIVSRVNLYVQTFLLLMSSRKVPNRFYNILGIMVFWTWFPLLVSCLPNWPERVMFVFASFTVTALQHIQFTLNHWAADVYVGLPKGNNWFEKQTSGSIDITCPPWMDWYHGGLQFQLEHHLFPRLPRGQLRKISPIVQDLCKKHNLSYRSFSFFDANLLLIDTLRKAAMQARNLSSPLKNSLLWEAVNTFG